MKKINLRGMVTDILSFVEHPEINLVKIKNRETLVSLMDDLEFVKVGRLYLHV